MKIFIYEMLRILLSKLRKLEQDIRIALKTNEDDLLISEINFEIAPEKIQKRRNLDSFIKKYNPKHIMGTKWRSKAKEKTDKKASTSPPIKQDQKEEVHMIQEETPNPQKEEAQQETILPIHVEKQKEEKKEIPDPKEIDRIEKSEQMNEHPNAKVLKKEETKETNCQKEGDQPEKEKKINKKNEQTQDIPQQEEKKKPKKSKEKKIERLKKKGTRRMESQNYADALDYFKSAQQLDPMDKDSRMSLITCMFQTHDYKECYYQTDNLLENDDAIDLNDEEIYELNKKMILSSHALKDYRTAYKIAKEFQDHSNEMKYLSELCKKKSKEEI